MADSLGSRILKLPQAADTVAWLADPGADPAYDDDLLADLTGDTAP